MMQDKDEIAAVASGFTSRLLGDTISGIKRSRLKAQLNSREKTKNILLFLDEKKQKSSDSTEFG